MRNHVGRVRELEVEGPGAVGEVGAVRVERALHVSVVHQRRQRVGDLDARCAQHGVVEVRDRAGDDRGARPLGELRGQLVPLLAGRFLTLQAPGPEGSAR